MTSDPWTQVAEGQSMLLQDGFQPAHRHHGHSMSVPTLLPHNENCKIIINKESITLNLHKVGYVKSLWEYWYKGFFSHLPGGDRQVEMLGMLISSN